MADKVTELPNVLSIQGEQQQDAGYVKASDEDVDLYVDRVSDEVLACRERGRHLFPAIRQAGIHFSEIDSDGLFVRRLTCTCCELAVKVEKWEGSRRGSRTRFHRVASHLEYLTGHEGQTYLSPTGRGRMTPRQIGDSVASKALAGHSVAALRKAITKTTPKKPKTGSTAKTGGSAKTGKPARKTGKAG